VSARRRPRLLALGVVLTIAGAPLSGCKEVEAETATGYVPAKLEPVEGKAGANRITFTAEGAERTGLQVAEVRRSGAQTVVPYAALIYDAQGKTYVYTSPAPRSFLREEVKVDHIDGDEVSLSAGPPVTTKVVTVGAAEVHGTELDVPGSH
jgi:hypothetical protein